MSEADMRIAAGQQIDAGLLLAFAVNPRDPFTDALKKHIIKTQGKVVNFIPAANQLLHKHRGQNFYGRRRSQSLPANT